MVSKWASSVDSYTKILDTLNEMQKKALALTGASPGIATGAAAIPGDATTPKLKKKVLQLCILRNNSQIM